MLFLESYTMFDLLIAETHVLHKSASHEGADSLISNQCECID